MDMILAWAGKLSMCVDSLCVLAANLFNAASIPWRKLHSSPSQWPRLRPTLPA